MEIPVEKWSSKIAVSEIGAATSEGGTRTKKVVIGGHGAPPFLDFEGAAGKPVTCLEVHDIFPEEWPETLKNAWGTDILKDPAAWAKKAEGFLPDMLCLRLFSADPDTKNSPISSLTATVKSIIQNTTLPLIITGCGNVARDMEILPEIIEAAKGEKCLIGIAVKDNFKTIAAACMSSGHLVIAESPLDVNLAKQLNILITDLGFPVERIIMHHTTGALGYGLEYTYSIMERTRLAGLSGDKMLSSPMLNFIGQEVWKCKEAKSDESELPAWGKAHDRGVNWEITTSMAYLQSGCDILVLNHPDSLKGVKRIIAAFHKP